jgi:hypothetical protein
VRDGAVLQNGYAGATYLEVKGCVQCGYFFGGFQAISAQIKPDEVIDLSSLH